MLRKSLESRELQEVVNRIVTNFRVYAVVLTGSRARGDYKPWSDYDLLIIADFEETYLDRIKNILEKIGNTLLNIEPHPYTLEEVKSMLKKGNPLIVDALSEGVVLYKTNEFEEIVKLYRELVNKGLRKTEASYILPSSLDNL